VHMQACTYCGCGSVWQAASTLVYVVSPRLCSDGNSIAWMWSGEVLTLCWGPFSASLAWHAGLGVLYAVWGRRYAPSMFAERNILNVHGHGWWGWQACCGGLGRVWTVCLCGLPHTSSVREATGTTSWCVGGGCGRLPAVSPCFLTYICVMSARMCSGGNLMDWV
jgi:hypothetical protein